MDDRDETVVDLQDAPVTIELEAMGEHDSVVTALATHYERMGHETHQLWVGDLGEGVIGMFDLYVPDLKRLIDVVTNDTLISIDSHNYGPWRAAGYAVWMAAPQNKTHVVERRLKDSIDRIQPWTTEGHKVVFPALAEQ